MPFGLKNAPQIYQRLVYNALYGVLKISRSSDAGATTDVFQTGIADDPDRESVWRSYIDDIMIAAESWDQMYRRVEDLLEACDKWNLSICVAKRFWGMDNVGYLGHRVSIGGLEANPKDLKSLTDLPFAGSLRSMQSFLGSLNYYSRFIKDYAIFASVLNELREVEFAELEKRSYLRETMDRNDPILRDHDPPEPQLTGSENERWIRAHKAFTTLKTKIVTTPILRHFDEMRTPVIIVNASDWAIPASLTQEHDGIFHPVAFASRTLKTNELNYNVTEKEMLALLKVLDLYYNLLGRLGQWSALLAPWTLEITKCTKGEDEILGTIDATITLRVNINDALTEIAPRKEPKRRIQAPIPTHDRVFLPGWEVVKAISGYLGSPTVNEAEYNGLILGLDMLENLYRRRLVLCGDSNLVIRQIPKTKNPVMRIAAVTTRAGSARSPAGVMQEDLIREIRVDRIKQAQEQEVWIAGMNKYLSSHKRKQDRKGKPVVRGESPGNLQATYPFQIIAMNHIPSLPRSHKGNTDLLIWVDLFTGYVSAKASPSRPAQTVAESYKECVFRQFGASEMIRHDREPGFISDFFRAFNKILGHRQRATMAYRPQANGTAQRIVQTAARALKMYVRDLGQKDWDEYAERLTFAINTAHDRIRGDTPHYLVHAWDPRSSLEPTLPIEAGSRIWLYLDRVKEGYARKLAHLWHGPFRVAEKINEFSVQLEVAGTGYQTFPLVHVSKLKLVKDFPDRPRVELSVNEADRLDFDEILLPEDSWVQDLGADEYEVERISDPTWVDEADLNCGTILNAFLRERANRNRFTVMQSHEEMLHRRAETPLWRIAVSYAALEEDHMIAYWESTHYFEITSAMTDADSDLFTYHQGQRQRRIRAGESWRKLLGEVVLVMRAQWADIDFLLDPYFLHLPTKQDRVRWYPGSVSRAANLTQPTANLPEPTDLITVLFECDQADPWRNHYRDPGSAHPSLSIPCLVNKFNPPAAP
ncbi:reverse transcriptase [Phytophthora megakarya]|uniref:Reverse transcriptase n=1 Tax=Phytophthora megakarya TaxID=4795 RepID=A0A225VR97_9STRA|nr:reverse transcriptase [Phytophthora megakarya]